jgi:hypothetical protein
MKYPRGLAVLALSIAAVISLGVPVAASAAPSTGSKVVVWGEIDTGTRSSAAQLAPVSYISNQTGIGIGVAYAWRGQGVYDAILPGGRRTDGDPLYWNQAEVFYIGAGYCVDGYQYWGGWRYYATARGPITVRVAQHIDGETTARWSLRDLRSIPAGQCG